MTLPSQPFLLLFPGDYATAKPSPLVIYHGGVGETASASRTDALKQSLIQAILDAGYIVAASNAHGDNWGNDDALADYLELYRFTRLCLDISRTVLLSQSMGGCSGLLTAADRPFAIKGWAGIYPVCDLRSIYDLGGLTASIKTAYSIAADGSNYDAQTAGHDPILQPATDYSGLRMRFYASDGDTIVPKADNSDNMAALVGATATEYEVVACSGNHGDASHFQAEDLIAFFDRCV